MRNRLRVPHRWCSSDDVDVLRGLDEKAVKRKYLVFVSTAPDVGFDQNYLRDANRSFDLAVRYYAQPEPDDPLLASADYVLTGGLSKYHSARQFLLEMNLQDCYDGYLFVDGDVKFGGGEIDRLLAMSTAMNFDLSQAATTHESHTSWHVTKASVVFLCRETSFVEVMAPYFSRSGLKAVLHTFDQSISSYGLDFVWAKILGTRKVGIFDSVQMHHAKPIDMLNGSFYTYLRSINVDPPAEQEKLLRQYGISHRERPHDVAGYVLMDKQSRSKLLRVPLSRFPRALIRLMRWQDNPAIFNAKIFGRGTIVSLQRELP